MTGLRAGCTGCRGADGALPKASKIQKERHLLSADVSLLRRDGQNRYFKISKRYRRPTPPAFWPVSPLRRTSVLLQGEFTSPEHFNHRRVERPTGAKPKRKCDLFRQVAFSFLIKKMQAPATDRRLSVKGGRVSDRCRGYVFYLCNPWHLQ